MAKKKKQIKETTIENYYDLKTKEVDDLVEALKSGSNAEPKDISTNITEITGEEVKSKKEKDRNFDPYKRDKLSALPTWLKALFIKWWFAGCVCFFIMMGLGMYIASGENLMLITGAVLGLVVDIMVNPIFHFIESDRRELDPYMMFPFPFKKYWTLFANLIYYVGIMFLVNYAYAGINALISLSGSDARFFIEPLLFGTFCVMIDMAFIGIKDLIVYLVKRHKDKKIEGELDV